MEEKKLGSILISCNLISEKQLIEALNLQNKHSETPLGQILVKHGFVTEKDLNITLDYYDKRLKLGEILKRKKIISKGQLDYALELCQRKKTALGNILLQLNMVTESQLAEAISSQYDIPYLELKEHVFEPGLDKYLNKSYALKNRVAIVGEREGKLLLAMSIPLGPLELADIENAVDRKVSFVVAKDSDITFAHEQIYGGLLKTTRDIDLFLEDFSEKESYSKYVLEHNIEHLLKKLLTVAVSAKASDIHLENTEDGLSARFRIDGVLQKLDLGSADNEIHTNGPSLISRIKIQCELDIAERRRPQDGSFRAQITGNGRKRKVDFRVSIIPTSFGENVVIRVLDKVRPMSLDSLGFSPPDLNELKQLLNKPTGIYLVTGPTGSGKTSTLYAFLNYVHTPGVKILTAEDPIEYTLGGISQCEVNEKIGNSFAELLRSFLRQDPDYIMIGEMRDFDTSSIAIRAALTGHTVLSTLHTNDATSAITRLIDMNIDPSLLASTIRGVIAQRLIRMNCIHCREGYQPDNDLLSGLPEVLQKRIKHLHGTGCAICNYTGFAGRKLISEVWIPTQREALSINRSTDNTKLRKLVFQETSRKSMLQNGLALVQSGETTLEELLRSVPSELIEELREKVKFLSKG
jgi:type IV pilus assembly protein PilB